MRYVLIEDAKPGMVLAKAVYDMYSRMLIAEHQELTADYIEKLKIRGYSGFYIEDELSAGIVIEETISVELRNKGVEALRKNNIDTTLDVAKDIVGQILGSANVSLDMIDLRTFDDYTYRHSVNVAVLSTIIGMGMHLNRAMLEELCIAAIFHDLGKIMISPRILNKPARLTKEEFKLIKEHPRLSVDLLRDRWKVPSASRVGILFHHENEDGSGYPNGLLSDEIHIYAKIIHVADVYDALTSKRPYKDLYTPSEAIEYLMGGNNILFNGEVVRAFLKCVPVYPKGVMVTLSDGREGIVYENTNNPIRPKIRLKTGEMIDLSDETKNLHLTINPTSSVETDYSNEMAALPDDEDDGRKVILVVDGSISDLQLVRSALEPSYRVVMVKNGEEAIEYLQENTAPDIILSDILLPDMNGLDAIRHMKSVTKEKVPVVIVSALSDRKTVEECRSVCAKGYIVKPFRPLYLKERVDTILKKSDIDYV